MPLIGLAAAFFTVMGFSLSGENLEKIEYPWIHVELNYGASSGTSPEPNKTIIDHVDITFSLSNTGSSEALNLHGTVQFGAANQNASWPTEIPAKNPGGEVGLRIQG